MGFNKKVLSKAVLELDKAKAPAKPRDITVDPMGYWNPANQGKPVRVPGGDDINGMDITMHKVSQPIWAQPNVGPGAIMYPEENRHFSGASYVDETPMVKKGGTLKSKKYSSNISATNKLFAKNKLFQNKKSKIFDPNAKFKSGGSKLGPINLNPNPLSHYELNYGFNLPTKEDGGENEDEYMDLTDEEIQAYRDGGYVVEELPEAQEGGPQNTSGPRAEEIPTDVDAMNAMMKARMATDSEFGNPAAQRMTSPNPKTYDFGNGNLGTHFMASMGNQAVPLLQDKGGDELEYNENPPPSKEDMNFRTPEEAQYFAEHYKEVAPMMRGFKQGGYVQHELVKAQKGLTKKPLEISDPKEFKYRNKMYSDSLGLYNQSQKLYNQFKLPKITEEKFNEIRKKDDDTPNHFFDKGQYNTDKKNKIKKSFDNYMVTSTNSKMYDHPTYIKNNPDLAKYSDDIEKFGITLKNGTIKTPVTVFDNKPDFSSYNIYDPSTGTSYHYTTDYLTNKTELLHIFNNKMKPVRTDYFGSDTPILDESIDISEESKTNNKITNQLNKKYKNYYYDTARSEIYKKPTEPVKFVPKKNKPKTTVQVEFNKVNTLPLKLIEKFAALKPTIIPGKPYIKPKPNVEPRYGSLAGDENLDLPSNYTQAEREAARRQRDAQEYQRKNLEYQQQQRANKTVAQIRKQGGAITEAWEDELDDHTIELLRKAGYVVEGLD